MDNFDMNQLKINFRKMVAFDAVGDENAKNENVEVCLSAAEIIINSWSFSDLDNFYEEGLGENGTFLSDEVWTIAIGYALITRYTLAYDEYVEWSKKQKEECVYSLLKLVGIDLTRHRVIQEKWRLEKKTSYYREIVSKLEAKHQIINFTEKSTGITLFGKSIEINDIAENVSGLFVNLKNAHEYALSVFVNEFNKKCTSYKEASENIVNVLNDAIEAEWVKCRRYLQGQGINKDKVEKIHRQYMDNSDISFIKNELDDAYKQLVEMLDGEVVSLLERDMHRRSVNFVGGGFGLKGATKGIIAACVLNGVYSSLTTAMTKASAERLKSKFERFANELYLGDDAKGIYEELLAEISQTLRVICVEILFSNNLEEQTQVDEILDALDDEVLDKLSGDELRTLTSLLLFTYPYNFRTYEFVMMKFIGIKDELELIAEFFGLDSAIHNSQSTFVNRSKEMIVFSDIQIYIENKHTVVLDSLVYGGWKYKITIPMEASFFDKTTWSCNIIGSLRQEGFMSNQTEEIVIRYWGGIESEETFKCESKHNSSQILDKVNSWPDINIKDYSQKVDIITDGEQYRHILRAEMFYYGSNDVYMLTYADHDAYLNLCIGCSGLMGENAARIKEIVKGIKVIRESLSVKNRFAACSHTEVLELLQKDREKKAKSYFKTYKDELDLSFAIAFRKRFKALLYDTEYDDYSVNEYDYSIRNQEIIELMEEQQPIGQYILYYSSNLVVTDFNIMMREKDKDFIGIPIKDIIEIIPITDYYLKATPRLCLRLKAGKIKTVYIEEKELDEYLYIADLINIALDSLIDNKTMRYYKEVQRTKQKDAIFCEKCKKIARVRVKKSGILNHVSCGNCYAESKYVNRIIENKFLAIIDDNVNSKMKILETEAYYVHENADIKFYGVEEFLEQQEKFYDDTEELIQKYVLAMEGALDFKSAVIYRVLFKIILNRYADKSLIVNSYDYKLSPEAMVSRTLMKTEQIGQYVLYNDSELIITDFHIYINSNGSDYIYALDDLLEILPMEEYYGSAFKGICVRTKDDKTEVILDSSLSYLASTLDLINIVLETVDNIKADGKTKRYYEKLYTDDHEKNIYCTNCNRWSWVRVNRGTILNKLYCAKCYSSLIKVYSKIENAQISAQKNGLIASLADGMRAYVDTEVKEDTEKGGILALGISIQKEPEEQVRSTNNNLATGRGASEAETQETHEEGDWRYAKFNVEHVRDFANKFLAALIDTPLQKYVVNQSINNLLDTEFDRKMSYMRQINSEQVVLYYNGSVVITDHYVVWGQLVKEIENIQEIVWFNLESNYSVSKILIKTKHQNDVYACEDEKQDKLLSLAINVALEGIRDIDYQTEYDKYVCYCGKCGSRDVEIKGLFRSKCYKCGNSYTGALYKNYWNDNCIIETFKHKVQEKYVEGGQDVVKDESIPKAIEMKRTKETDRVENPILTEIVEITDNSINAHTSVIQERQMFCTNCGKKIPSSSKFCTFCGTANKYQR